MSSPTALNFTKKDLGKLPVPPAPDRSTYHDVQVRGLQLIVTSGGTRTFYVRKKVAGRSERIRIGPFPEVSVEQARRRALELLGRLALGENPAAQRRAHQAAMTLGELFAEYRQRTAGINRRPDKAEQTFRLYFGHWQDRRISTITFHEVDRLHKAIGTRVSGTTANIALKLLHALFNKAKYKWRIWDGDNPAHGVEKFPERSRERWLLPAEMPFFLNALDLEPNRTLADAVSMALYTGARRGNVETMSWNQIDLDGQLWVSVLRSHFCA